MAFEFQDRDSDALYRGRDLELVIDEDTDIGEVYLDGDLIFQADNIFQEDALKEQFKKQFEVVEAEPESAESDTIEEDDSEDMDYEMDYNDDNGLQERLYTNGGEYMTEDGREFVGDYHMHPKFGAMVGKFHGSKPHKSLMMATEEDIRRIRNAGLPKDIAIDYTVDEIGLDMEDF